MTKAYRVTILLVLLVAFIPSAAGANVPYDGLTLEYDYVYTFENQEYPSANRNSTDSIVWSFTQLEEDRFMIEQLGGSGGGVVNSDTRRYEDAENRTTSLWIPTDISVGDKIQVRNRTYAVTSLQDVVQTEDFGEASAIVLRYEKREDSTTLSEGGEAEDYLERRLFYYAPSSGVALKYIAEISYTHITDNFGDMYKTERTVQELQENSIHTDNDELTDAEELVKYGTDPQNPDTDGDGLTDSYEIRTANSNPLAEDTDADGLSDQEEDAAGTDPAVADTDGDGLSDARELEAGTNPTVADTDGDGLTDEEEWESDSDSLKADTDGDGLDDGQEVEAGTSVVSADTDGDGLSDSREVEASTNPLQADTDGDMLGDSLDPAPANAAIPLIPIALFVLAVGGGYIFYRKVEINLVAG